MVTDRPIIFSAPMVRAILDGRKTQTRRVLKPQPIPEVRSVFCVATQKSTGRPVYNMRGPMGGTICGLPCKHGLLGEIIPPYAVGDRLWVREAWFPEVEGDCNFPVWYRATEESTFPYAAKWKSPIFMPRWASRITLEVTGVKVERLQDISGEDTISEGVQCPTCEAMKVPACHDTGCFHSLSLFKDLWASIHGPGAWEANPWVAVIEFKRVQA